MRWQTDSIINCLLSASHVAAVRMRSSRVLVPSPGLELDQGEFKSRVLMTSLVPQAVEQFRCIVSCEVVLV